MGIQLTNDILANVQGYLWDDNSKWLIFSQVLKSPASGGEDVIAGLFVGMRSCCVARALVQHPIKRQLWLYDVHICSTCCLFSLFLFPPERNEATTATIRHPGSKHALGTGAFPWEALRRHQRKWQARQLVHWNWHGNQFLLPWQDWGRKNPEDLDWASRKACDPSLWIYQWHGPIGKFPLVASYVLFN